jgi:hypothetical protein
MQPDPLDNGREEDFMANTALRRKLRINPWWLALLGLLLAAAIFWLFINAVTYFAAIL